jgi:hypothetical protein
MAGVEAGRYPTPPATLPRGCASSSPTPATSSGSPATTSPSPPTTSGSPNHEIWRPFPTLRQVVG